MKRAILLVDHGSRRPEANALLEEVAGALRLRLPDCLVTLAHLEFGTPDIETAVADCVQHGAQELLVHPYFLAAGVHTRRDIPKRVRSATQRYPHLQVEISQPLGFHERIVDVVLERIQGISGEPPHD